MMQIPFYSVFPFAGWLLAIALLPLAAPHFWENNRNKAILGALFSLPVLVFCLSYDLSAALVHSGIEYLSFVILLGSLFTVSGGILITGDIPGTPFTNTLFLAGGAILANFIGTTGASMVLIRPFLRINSEREHTAHLPIFFIFLVSNIGGLLTPLADPPLFLGYLRGVPFLWTLRLLPEWAVAVGAILFIFFLFDSREHAKESRSAIKKDEEILEPVRFHGSKNILFLAGITLAVFLPAPWREGFMVAMGILSWKLTPREVHAGNSFSFGPIIEVAVLFAAIFITMVPALLLLKLRGGELGITRPWEFFWLTGLLSSFLDNAPTYLTFVSLAQGQALTTPNLPQEILGIPELFLKAVSVGAVFMGANTYIGNGPNFMVKTIAEEMGIKMPSFFGYMKYSLLILVPLFVAITLLFFL